MGPLGDTYGKRMFAYMGAFFTTISFVLFFVPNKFAVYAGILIGGIRFAPQALIHYSLVMDFSPGYETVVTGIIFFVDGLVPIWSTYII